MMPMRQNGLRTVMISQIVVLFLVLAMPLIIRWLNGWWGKVAYTGAAVVCVVLALQLRRLLDGGSEAK